MTGGAGRAGALALSALMLAACAGLGRARVEPPEISVAGLEFAEAGLLEQRFEVMLRIANPNDAPLELNGLRFDLLLNGEVVGQGLSRERLTVPRLGTALLPVEVSASLLEIVPALAQITSQPGLTYGIDGDLFLENEGTGRIAFSERGEVGGP